MISAPLSKVDLNDRVYGLDILRSIAILLVVGGHSFVLLSPWHGDILPVLNISVEQLIVPIINGIDGVDLFFVLSGFLIGGIFIRLIEKSEKITAAIFLNFWMRRWLRTMPAYYFYLFLYLAIFLIAHGNSWNPFFLQYFIFSQNIFHGELLLFPESWSLSVEEWFYLTLPILFFFVHRLFRRLKFKWVVLGVISIYLVLLLFLRFYATYKFGILNWNDEIRTSVLMRVDTIMFGVLAAWLRFYYRQIWDKLPKVGLLLSVTILSVLFIFGFLYTKWNWHSEFMSTVYYSFLSVGIALLLPYFSSIKTGKGVLFKFFTLTSLVSYSMYLLNYSLVLNLFSINENLLLAILLFIVYWLIVYVLSILSYSLIEKPVLKFRDRLLK